MNSCDASLTTGSFAIFGFPPPKGLTLQIDQTWTNHQFLLNEYGLHLASSGLSPSTSRYYMSDARQFIDWVAVLTVVPSYMDGEIALSYYDYLRQPSHQLRPNSKGGYSPSTIVRKLHSIRRFFDHLVDECILPQNSFREFTARIPLQTSFPREVSVLSVETIRELISTCDISKPTGIRDRTLLLSMAGLGLRVGEVRLLDSADVNLKDFSLTVTYQNNQARTIPLPNEIAASFELWLVVRALHAIDNRALFTSLHHSKGRGEPGKRLSNRGIRSIVNRRLVLVGAKKPGVSCEVLRRSAIVHLLSNGAALEGVRSMFGLTPKTLKACQEYVTEICPGIKRD